MMKNKNMGLSEKLLLLSTSFLILASIVIIAIVNIQLKKQALIDAENKVRIILKERMAIIQYYTRQLRPPLFKLIKAHNIPDSYFEPTWMSAGYANREIFKYFKKQGFKNYYYKNAARHARNEDNEANSYELNFLKKQNAEKAPGEWSGVKNLDGAPYFVYMETNQQKFSKFCMKCHSTPERAPAGLVKQYGPTRGFDREIGEIASVISIRIPLEKAYAGIKKTIWKLSLILVSVVCLSFLFHWLTVSFFIVKPVKALRSKVLHIKEDGSVLGRSIHIGGSRELVELSEAFNMMASNLRKERDLLEERVEDRTRELNEANSQLEKEIEEHINTISKLEKSRDDIRTLQGIIPICMHCHKIRNDEQIWDRLEAYLMNHTNAELSHAICPECARKYYPDMDIYDEDETQE
jgi:hypothetical protein